MISKIRADFERLLKSIPRPVIVAGSVILTLLILELANIIDCREHDAYDFRMKIRPAEKAHRDIVLFLIDDHSLQALGPWPWKRRLHAELIEALKSAGTKAIFFDVLFPERSQDPIDDKIFAAAIQHAGNIVLPFHYITRKPFHAIFPLPEFLNHARQTGYANVEIDRKDGVVRDINPFLHVENVATNEYYQTAVAVYLSLFEHAKDAGEWLRNFSNKFHQKMLINYPGGLESYQKISAGEVFEKSKTPEGQDFLKRVFNGKIVLLGDISTGTTDLRSTPVQPMMPGLLIQAGALNTIMTGRYLYEIPAVANYILAFMLAWLAALYGQKLKPHWAFAATLAQMLLFFALNCWIFIQFRIVFYLPMPLVAMFIVFVVSLFLRYVDVRVESDFLARELEMASKIQQSLLPASDLKLAEIDAGFRCLFYERVGGDLYDWMELGNGRVAICLGDVSGKGVPAALYMSRALNELRHQVRGNVQPGEILSQLNHSLAQGETSGMFLTLFFLIIDFKEKKIRFSNAGHDPMVFYRSKTQRAELIETAGGLPIGIMDDHTFETGELAFESGDIILLTSDGIKEQKSPQGEMFGSERLQASLSKAFAVMNASQVIDHVMADVMRFAAGRAPHDDRTLVCARLL